VRRYTHPMSIYAIAADAMLAAHVAVVLFVVVDQLLIVIGGVLRWRWVRHFWWRIVHLLLMVYIAAQAWLGELCPLTVWEQALRAQAGQHTYGESFIEHWLSRLLYIEAPWWVFVAIYTGFALVVLASWFWVLPKRSLPKNFTY
jgi:Protein of Unknown function (DUF2784)